jgi:hypothetical protein
MKIYKFIIAIFIATTAMFVACEDYVDTEVLSPEVPEGCQGVYFPTTNTKVFELEPTQATEITLKIGRDVKSGAVDVPIVVLVNDEDIYNVPETVSFADGDTLVSFTVTFPNAAEGVTYNLKLAAEGDQYVNPYSAKRPDVATKVTRVKWTPIEEPMVYVDGAFTAGWSVGTLPMYVNAEKAEFTGLVRYRFKNAYKRPTGPPDADGIYDGYPYSNANTTFDDSKDYYTVIEINTSTSDVFMEAHEIGLNWGYGMISIGSVYKNLSTNIGTYPLGKLKDGIITFPANSLFFSEAEYNDGAAYPSTTPTKIYLTKDIYIADNMKIDDYNKVDYELVDGEVSLFKSVAFDYTWNQTLEIAIDIDEENDDSEYKNLYYLADLYAWDYGLAFYYKEGGLLTIPADQPTGIEFLGNEVFMSQSATIKSGVEVKDNGVTVYSFGLMFHYEDGTIVGDFKEQFYYSEDEVVFEKSDFIGKYNLTGPSLLGQAAADMDVEIAEGETTDELVITGVRYATEIIATFDAETATMIIAPQELPDYNDITDLYLYTFDGGVSTTSTIEFKVDVLGVISIASSSVGFGYAITDDPAEGFYPSYYNLVFTPISSKSSASQQSISSVSVRSQINYVERVDVQEKSEPNFKVQGKTSPKKIKSNISVGRVF